MLNDLFKFLDEYPLAKIAIIIAAAFIIFKFVLEILKVAKLVNLEDKNVFEALYSGLFRKHYFIRKGRKALKNGNFYEAGKTFEEVGEYKLALNAYESGEQYNEMGELYEKLNRETQAIEIYKKSGNFDKLIKLYLKRKNIEMAGNLLEDNNRFQEAAELYYNHERYDRAAQIYEKKGFYKKAAYIYEKAGNLKKAAVNFENGSSPMPIPPSAFTIKARSTRTCSKPWTFILRSMIMNGRINCS